MKDLQFRTRTSSGRLCTAPDGVRVLQRLGITTPDELLGCEAGEVVAAARDRVVRRLAVPGGGNVYLKSVRRRVRRLLAGASEARREYLNLRRLRAAGVAAAEPLVLAESRPGARLSVLMTREITGVSLDEFLRRRCSNDAHPIPLDDAKVERACWELLASLFARGLFPVDLVPKHILLQASDAGVVAQLIDVHRLECASAWSAKRVAACIARLDAEIPRALLGTAERRRLARRWLGARLPAVEEHMRKLEPRLRQKRRFSRNLSSRRDLAVHATTMRRTRDGSGSIALSELERAHVSADSIADGASLRDLLSVHSDVRILDGSVDDVRRLVNVVHGMRMWMRCAEVVGFSASEGSPAWIAWREDGLELLNAGSGAISSDDAEALGGQMSAAVVAFAVTKFWPRSSIQDVLARDRDMSLVFVPRRFVDDDFDRSARRERALRTAVARDLGDLGFPAPLAQRLALDIRFEIPGLLGRRWPIFR